MVKATQTSHASWNKTKQNKKEEKTQELSRLNSILLQYKKCLFKWECTSKLLSTGGQTVESQQ